jgi:HEAT repeat protein
VRGDPHPTVRGAALTALPALGEDAIPALVEFLAGTDATVRLNAMTGLERFRGGAKPAVPALIDILKKGQPHERWQAARTLGRIGPEARDALDALREAARDSDQTVKEAAANALKQIDQK